MPATKKKKLRPPFKCHGGKYFLSSWIINRFPKNYQEMDYIEPYSGAASVLLNKEPSQTEVLNDENLGIVQIFRALREEPKHFIRKLKRTTYSERVFNRVQNHKNDEFDDYMDHAVNEFILRRMSRGGLMQAFAWSDRKRGGQPGDVNAWETILQQLPETAKRLQDVFILNKPAIEVIKAFNEENVICYCDPPYVQTTRTSPDAYDQNEMSDDDHIELANLLKSFKGKVLISGYSSALYRTLYGDWKCCKKSIANHSSQQKNKKQKTECLWMNF